MPVLSTLGAAIANVYGFTSGLIKDQYFNLVSLLLPGNGTNGAQNNTFLDSGTANSGSGFPITRNPTSGPNAPTQGTFSPFSQTGWSAYFDGSNDYVSMPDSTAFTMGSGDFTIECWVYKTTSGRQYITGQSDSTASSGSASFELSVNASNKLVGSVTVSTTTYSATSTADFPLNTWKHVAFVRNSGTTRLYIGGEQDGTNATLSTNSINDSANQVAIGRLGEYNGLYWNGYISNFRITKGGCLYPNGTTFTPSITPLTTTVLSGTVSLLTCQNNRFIDNAATPNTLTANNGVAITPFSPFAPTAKYEASAVGGSGYFDVVDDFLTWGPGSSVQFGTGNFTIEVWIYITVTPAGQYIIDARNSGQTTAFALLFGASSSGRLAFFDGSIVAVEEATPSIKANEWTHCCVVRSGSTISLFINGVRAGVNSSYSGNMSTAPTLSYIGKRYAAVLGEDFEFPGYMSSLRIVKGTAVYDPTQTNITIPTAPLTAITNTSLLLNFTNAGVVDATAKNVLETVGNAQISTTQSKWGGGSISIDSSSSYLTVPSSQLIALGSGDWTVEGWFYFSNVTGIKTLFDQNASTRFYLYLNGTSLNYYTAGSLRITGGTLAQTTWYHIALVRYIGTTKLYLDGTQIGSSYPDSQNYGAAQFVIGSYYGGADYLNGYLDDCRISKMARYTGNFTKPSAPFPVQ